ncbi:hypothetical protein BDK51DRAFT_38705, partial [Blyttiomyces helicus]
ANVTLLTDLLAATSRAGLPRANQSITEEIPVRDVNADAASCPRPPNTGPPAPQTRDAWTEPVSEPAHWEREYGSVREPGVGLRTRPPTSAATQTRPAPPSVHQALFDATPSGADLESDLQTLLHRLIETQTVKERSISARRSRSVHGSRGGGDQRREERAVTLADEIAIAVAKVERLLAVSRRRGNADGSSDESSFAENDGHDDSYGDTTTDEGIGKRTSPRGGGSRGRARSLSKAHVTRSRQREMDLPRSQKQRASQEGRHHWRPPPTSSSSEAPSAHSPPTHEASLYNERSRDSRPRAAGGSSKPRNVAPLRGPDESDVPHPPPPKPHPYPSAPAPLCPSCSAHAAPDPAPPPAPPVSSLYYPHCPLCTAPFPAHPSLRPHSHQHHNPAYTAPHPGALHPPRPMPPRQPLSATDESFLFANDTSMMRSLVDVVGEMEESGGGELPVRERGGGGFEAIEEPCLKTVSSVAGGMSSRAATKSSTSHLRPAYPQQFATRGPIATAAAKDRGYTRWPRSHMPDLADLADVISSLNALGGAQF